MGVMTAITSFSESCRAIPRLVEGIKVLVIINFKNFYKLYGV